VVDTVTERAPVVGGLVMPLSVIRTAWPAAIERPPNSPQRMTS
jgi:hypothetical protein